MVVDERRRDRLRERLREVLGPDEGSDLMELLPSVRWDEVATKRDLDALASQMRAEFRGELNSQTRTLIVVLSSMFLSVAGLAFAIARLT